MANLYRNPNGTIARRSDGKLMRAPTQAEFEDCCCNNIYKLTPCYDEDNLERCPGGSPIYSRSSVLEEYVDQSILYDEQCWSVEKVASLPSGVTPVTIVSVTDSYASCYKCCAKCVRGDCTFNEDSTITGYSRHRWELFYSDPNCQILDPTPWKPHEDWVETVGLLEALWTKEDLTNCGVWQGEGTVLTTLPGTDYPPTSTPIRLQLRYTDSNVWQYRVSFYFAEAWTSWGYWYNVYNAEYTLNQSDCEGYSHSYDSGCALGENLGDNCSFTVQNNPLP